MRREDESLPCPVVIIGPTAAGKSDLSLIVAAWLSGHIVNADSMQLYRGMDIGTAKLSITERRGIPHHLFDVWDVTHTASVAEYKKRAVACITDMRTRGVMPVIVGGSMMYIQSLIDEWDFPPTDPAVRARYLRMQDMYGAPHMHALLARKDPAAAAIIEPNDPRRNVRALEVIELTGRPYAATQPVRRDPPRWDSLLLGLDADPEWLNDRIERRTQRMFADGFLDEVARLVDAGLVHTSTAGRAIGYAQALRVIQGEITTEEAISLTVQATRRYVRRQRSWFRRDPRIRWIPADGDVAADAAAVLRAQGYTW